MRCDNKMKEKVGEIRKICESYLEYIDLKVIWKKIII